MALTVEAFIERWIGKAEFYHPNAHPIYHEKKSKMKADLEEMVFNAKTEGIWAANEAFDKGQRLVSLKMRSGSILVKEDGWNEG